ncbi:MAG TPA: glycosyltransferase [Pyrinomonadaceae bacterium]|nr:glycosyltransferase [Pyrinomonadaceae bacterium]
MATKRNVCLLLNSFDMGGAEGQILLLARLLRDAGYYQPHLACLSRSGVLLPEAERLGLGEIPEFPLTGFYDRNMATQLRRFTAFLREREADVVHTDGFYTNVFGLAGGALARLHGRVGFRGETAGWRTPRQDMFERFVFRLAHLVHANSEAVKKYLVERGVPEKRVTVVYNGVDTERVKPVDVARDHALKKLALPHDSRRRFVAIVANMRHDVKDHPMFLRAAKLVRAKVPDAAFVLAGEGELMESLRGLAAELKLENDAFFIGRCDHIPELLAVADVCVLTSKAEGFSNSILEYMAAARAVVATDVGGAREVIADGESGYLVQSGDDETLAARIVSLLLEPERAQEMGRRGRQIVEQKFSCAVQLERTQEMYDRAIAVGSRLRGGKISVPNFGT